MAAKLSRLHVLTAHGSPASWEGRHLFQGDCLECHQNMSLHFTASVMGHSDLVEMVLRVQAEHCLAEHPREDQ
ncbi:hypothetical protein GCM10010357_64730 [Streptomyces luteireticuli]|uniref:Uncharacterized protein n=1 Tax=Streptomyces luteireticuli TaxID=173858 RepID=A0ABN0Z5C0_9ACTN